MSGKDIEFVRLAGEKVHSHLPEVARLRIAVFREWPYLYDGDFEYENNYLRTYAASPGSIIVAAVDANTGEVVGAATGVPMSDADEAVRGVFTAAGYDPREWFYHGESVLLPAYRGRGIGVRFFREREAQARALGCRHAAFCGVIRSADDPRRPPGYVPLDDFWRRRGYTPMPGMECAFSWKELGATEEKAFPLAFWRKELGDAEPV
ncbi:GNAT family N-acetyltransferase [Anaeroselena agilis]|uniref:GNAT family N-acetyltransferase n=1 Tax=Anaeroselena agilis TaxID=3063788 RepID=A0ABU3NZ35_9FIRM|nr:GNAT family N-acetyltransferase [Selenomonadales bacterium 4137-cl]